MVRSRPFPETRQTLPGVGRIASESRTGAASAARFARNRSAFRVGRNGAVLPRSVSRPGMRRGQKSLSHSDLRAESPVWTATASRNRNTSIGYYREVLHRCRLTESCANRCKAALLHRTGYCRIDGDAPGGTEIIAAASFDAIRIGSLSRAIRTPPRVKPAKKTATSIKIIVPSFRGPRTARSCLSKSSWSRWSILEFLTGKAKNETRENGLVFRFCLFGPHYRADNAIKNYAWREPLSRRNPRFGTFGCSYACIDKGGDGGAHASLVRSSL